MVGSELGLEPVGRAPQGTGHDTGVVEKDIEGIVAGQVRLGESPDAGHVSQVGHPGLEVGARHHGSHLGHRPLGPLRAPGQQGHRGTVGGQGPGALPAQPTGRSGDEKPATGEVHPVEHVVGRRVPAEFTHGSLPIGRDLLRIG